VRAEFTGIAGTSLPPALGAIRSNVENIASGEVAEGEELGSNILQFCARFHAAAVNCFVADPGFAPWLGEPVDPS
jgi:hypothetical protein